MFRLALAASLSQAASASTLATFDGAAGTTFEFDELNDPVMGGKSTGTWAVDNTKKVGVFDGEVVNVPSLGAPGFIKAAADAKYFPDASSAGDDGVVVLKVRTTTPEYKGYRVTVTSGASIPAFACGGGGALPLSRGCYKAKFSVPQSTKDEFQTVKIPLSSFSDLWSSATGEHTKECSDDASACLTSKKLSKIQRLEVWAEGVAGKIHLEVQEVSIEPASIEGKVDGSKDIDLATFDGKAPHKWHAESDPVMGGKSSSSVTTTSSYADFQGTCRIVPALKAPGFTIAMTEGFPLLSKFPDVSSTDGLTVSVRNIGNFSGYKVAFCDSQINFYRCQLQSFKADLVVPASPNGEFQDVFVPWSKFSDKWNSATGKHTEENPPTASSLKSITQLQIWTEAVEGDFHLQIQRVRATTNAAAMVIV